MSDHQEPLTKSLVLTIFSGGDDSHLARNCPTGDATKSGGGWKNSGGNSYGGGGRECYKCGGLGHLAKYKRNNH